MIINNRHEYLNNLRTKEILTAMIQKYNRGSVWWYNFGDNSFYNEEHVIYKRRPCVIVSNNQNNLNSEIVIIAPITTRKKNECKAWQVYFYNERDQIIQLEQLRAVNKNCLKNYDGQLDDVIMRQVDEALALQLDIPINNEEHIATIYLDRFDKQLSNIIENRFKDNSSQIKSYFTTLMDVQKNYQADINKALSNINSDCNESMLAKLSALESLRKKQDEDLCKILNNMIKLMSKLSVEFTPAPEALKLTQNDSKIESNIKSQADNKTQNKANFGVNNNTYKNMSPIEKFNTKWARTPIETNLNKSKQTETKSNLRKNKLNYKDTDSLLAFLKDCNELQCAELCEKYGLTKKQLYNRKYGICKYLHDNNIDYPKTRIGGF